MKIALIAHDKKKNEIIELAKAYQEVLSHHELCATGTTGTLIMGETGLKIQRMKSGPLGGDQQLGALISEGKIDYLIFFWDPMTSQPHDVDVKALLRLSVLYDVPTACNRASADFLVNSMLFGKDYKGEPSDYSEYLNRSI